MANVEIPSYKRMTKISEKEIKKEINIPKISIDEIIVGIVSFLMSRVVIVSSMSPFGVSFFASGKIKKNIFMYIGACLGILTVRQDLQALKYITAMTVFSVLKSFIKNEKTYKDSVFAGGLLFCSGFVFSLAGYMLTYDLLMLALESFVCGFFVLIFTPAANYINNKKFFSYISNEQILSLTFVIALSLSGLGRTVNIGYFNLCEIMCSVIVMILAMNRGSTLGACGGVIAGIVCALGKENIMNIVGVYALCGFVAGCLKNMGKAGVCAGFLLSGSCAGFLSSSSFIDTANLLNMILGSCIFVALPKKVFEKIRMFTDGIMLEPDDVIYMKKAKEYISLRLKNLISSYDKLSQSISMNEKNILSDKQQIQKAVNHAIGNVCAKCGMKNICWEKQKNTTQKMLERTEFENVPESTYVSGVFEERFQEKCIKFSEFSNSINHYFSLKRTNDLWRRQIFDSRCAISAQYKEFSNILEKLHTEISSELSGESGYESKREKKILNKLSNAGLEVIDICIREVNRDSFNVRIKFVDEKYESMKKNILQIVSEVLDTNMNFVKSTDENTVILEPIYRYFPMCASATVRKNNKEANGDSIIKVNMSNSKFFMAISDGMGSGNAASVKSNKTNFMLKELISTGYSPIAAVKTVNTALTAGDEVFATVDMALINLTNGEAEFVKIGAMPSLLVRKDITEVIFKPNLPIGILNIVEAESVVKKLSKDDLIIMFSDGMCDINKGFEWINQCANELRKKKCDEICEVILKEAIIRNHGKIKDDMSVIVFKLMENL